MNITIKNKIKSAIQNIMNTIEKMYAVAEKSEIPAKLIQSIKIIISGIASTCLALSSYAETIQGQEVRRSENNDTSTKIKLSEKNIDYINKVFKEKEIKRNINIETKIESEKVNNLITQNIVMYSGEVLTLQTGGISRVAVGNGKLLSSAVIDGKKLLLIAQDVGDTNILLWKDGKQIENIKVRITATDTERVLEEIKGLLIDIPEIQTKKSGDRIYIDGENLASEQLGIIRSIKEQYPNIIDRTSGVPKKIKPAAPPSMVMFDVFFIEFKKNYTQELGVSWQKTFNGVNFGIFGESTSGPISLRPGTTGGTGPTYTPALPANPINGVSTAFNISAAVSGMINLAVSNGQATLLAAPKLAVRSGGKAKFLAGGEFPIAISGFTANTVEYKEYGILLEVNPILNQDETVSGTISTEVSALDPAVNVNGYPGISKRRTETDFYTNMGQAIVLSGLYTQENSQSDDKVPLLGDIPIVNALFKNRAENRKNSELVVFIIPTEHSSKNKLNEEIIDATKTNSFRVNSITMGEDILPKLRIDSKIWKGNIENFTRYKENSSEPLANE